MYRFDPGYPHFLKPNYAPEYNMFYSSMRIDTEHIK